MRDSSLRDGTSDSAAPLPGWALVVPWDPLVPGGVSQVVLNLANGLKTQGVYRPIVIVQDWAAARPHLQIRNGIQYVFIRMRSPSDKSVKSLKRIMQSLLGWSEGRRIMRLIYALNIRIINFHWPTLAAEPFVDKIYVVSGRPLKIIFSLHGMDIVGAVNHDTEYRARYLRMLVRGGATVAVSHGFAELVTKELAPELSGTLSVSIMAFVKRWF
jgi:hypothetical protein